VVVGEGLSPGVGAVVDPSAMDDPAVVAEVSAASSESAQADARSNSTTLATDAAARRGDSGYLVNLHLACNSYAFRRVERDPTQFGWPVAGIGDERSLLAVDVL
jgi:hypothetical protein